jgi:hypothetical protein
MRTPKKDSVFFAALAQGEPVGSAAIEAGYSRSSVYEYRKADSAFAAAWLAADEEGVEGLEREARKRALADSDTMLIFLLKAKRPTVYRERASYVSITLPKIETLQDTVQAGVMILTAAAAGEVTLEQAEALTKLVDVVRQGQLASDYGERMATIEAHLKIGTGRFGNVN